MIFRCLINEVFIGPLTFSHFALPSPLHPNKIKKLKSRRGLYMQLKHIAVAAIELSESSSMCLSCVLACL